MENIDFGFNFLIRLFADCGSLFLLVNVYITSVVGHLISIMLLIAVPSVVVVEGVASFVAVAAILVHPLVSVKVCAVMRIVMVVLFLVLVVVVEI